RGWRVTVSNGGGTATEWAAGFVVDATGRDTLLTSKLGLKRVNKHNNTAAVFGHFRNVPRRAGDKEGMITVYLFEHGWFWMIPLPDEVMSVGVVGTQAFFRERNANLETLFASAVAETPNLASHMKNA